LQEIKQDFIKKKAILVTNTFSHNIHKCLNNIQKDFIVIAVDGGLNSLYSEKIECHYIIGDLDSVKKEAIDFYSKKSKIIQYPKEKDFTDTEIAIQWCKKNKIEDILILNSMENRFDHSLGVLNCLFLAQKDNLKCEIFTGEERIFLADQNWQDNVKKKSIVSLISISNSVTKINTTGLKYPLKYENLNRFECRGLSNIAINNKISISHESGDLLVVINISEVN